jgi:hypothetical protein
MLSKCKLLENISLHAQRLNCGACVYELEYHVGEKKLNLNWLPMLGLINKKPLLQVFSISY